MKLLHTADWHLGKTLKGQNLIDDQKFILNEIFKVIDDEKPDAILIAGDIYDRNIPPVDAVELFNETLNRFAEKNLPTLIISGNHDSAKRLNFGSKIFQRQNIFIAAKIDDNPKNLVLEDDFGEIHFSMIPYFEPAYIKDEFFDENSERLTFNAANRIYVDFLRQKIPAGKRSVAIAHIFLTGGIESESERKFVGGAENVNAEIFSGYNYVALGHLHRSQKILTNNIQYSGSPLKYSFDEYNHKKSVTIVEIDGFGDVKTKKIELKPLHDVKIVKGTFDEVKNHARTEDFICVKLTERVINVQDKLAWIFPNLLSVEFHLPQNFSDEADKTFSEGNSPLEYFSDFYKAQTGEELKKDYREAMKDFFLEISKEE